MNIPTKTYYFPIEKILLRLNEYTLAMRFIIENFESDFEIKEEISEEDVANIFNSSTSKKVEKIKEEIIIEIHIFDELKEINFTVMNCTSGETINTTVKVEEYAKHFNSSILFKKDPLTWFKHMILSKDSTTSLFLLEEKFKASKEMKEQVNWSLFIEEYDEIYKKSVKHHRTNFISTNNYDFKEFYSTPVVSMKKFVESIFTSSTSSKTNSSNFEESSQLSDKIFAQDKNCKKNEIEAFKYDDEIFRQNKINQEFKYTKPNSKTSTEYEKNLVINNLFCRYKNLLDLFIVNESLFIDFKEILIRCHHYLNTNVTKTINEIEKVYSEEIDNLFLDSLEASCSKDNDQNISKSLAINNNLKLSILYENKVTITKPPNLCDRINLIMNESNILNTFNECYLTAHSIPAQYKIHEICNLSKLQNNDKNVFDTILGSKDEKYIIVVETVNSTKYSIIYDINLSPSNDKKEKYFIILNYQDMSHNMLKHDDTCGFRSKIYVRQHEDTTNYLKILTTFLFEENYLSDVMITIKAYFKSLVEPPNILNEKSGKNPIFDYEKTTRLMKERKEKRIELYNKFKSEHDKEQARNKGLFLDFEIDESDVSNNLYLNVYNAELIVLKRNIYIVLLFNKLYQILH